MNPFIEGFNDELIKLAVAKQVLKGGKGLLSFLWKHPIIASGAIGGTMGGYAAAKGAAGARRAVRSIRPSRAWLTNYYRALRIPRRMTALERRRLFRHARAVPGRYRK
jgi:hypothetical protein